MWVEREEEESLSHFFILKEKQENMPEYRGENKRVLYHNRNKISGLHYAAQWNWARRHRKREGMYIERF